MFTTTENHNITFTNSEGEDITTEAPVGPACDHIDPNVQPCADGSTEITYAVLDTDHTDSPLDQTCEWEADDAPNFGQMEPEDITAWQAENAIDPNGHPRQLLTTDYNGAQSTYEAENLAEANLAELTADHAWFLTVDPEHAKGVPADSINGWAIGLAEECEAWANGETYGIVTITADTDGEIVSWDSIWGFIGTEHAQGTVGTGV